MKKIVDIMQVASRDITDINSLIELGYEIYNITESITYNSYDGGDGGSYSKLCVNMIKYEKDELWQNPSTAAGRSEEEWDSLKKINDEAKEEWNKYLDKRFTMHKYDVDRFNNIIQAKKSFKHECAGENCEILIPYNKVYCGFDCGGFDLEMTDD